METKIGKILFLALFVLISSCTSPLLECIFTMSDFEKTYKFSMSKDELKNRIVSAYTYKNNLFWKNLGKHLIQNEEVDSVFNRNIETWLNKQNWDDYSADIRENTTDSLIISIKKHHIRKVIKFNVIISGDDLTSYLKINNIQFQRRRRCVRKDSKLRNKISKTIEKKFIENLGNT